MLHGVKKNKNKKPSVCCIECTERNCLRESKEGKEIFFNPETYTKKKIVLGTTITSSFVTEDFN